MSQSDLEYIRSVTGQTVTVQDFDWRELMEDGVIAEVTIGRWRGKMRLTPEDLGLPAEAIKEQELTELLHLGDKLLLPAKTLRSLQAVESRARAKLRRAGFETHWGIFIPVTAYQTMKRDLDECKTDYFRLRNNILDQYDDLKSEMYMSYLAAGRVAYDRLMQQNYLPYGSNREIFAEDFANRILVNIPPAAEIYASFEFEVRLSYIPLPALLDQKAERAASRPDLQEDAEEYERRRAREKMQRDIITRAQEDKEKLVNQFLDDIQNQLNSTVHNVCVDVLQALTDNDRLNNRNVVSLKKLIETVSQLNFYKDQDVEQAINRVREDITSRQPDERSKTSMEKTLRSIVTLTRSKLIDLGERPRDARNLDISADPSPEEIQLARRTLAPPSMDFSFAVPEMAERKFISPNE
jgi:hypothetical protein